MCHADASRLVLVDASDHDIVLSCGRDLLELVDNIGAELCNGPVVFEVPCFHSSARVERDYQVRSHKLVASWEIAVLLHLRDSSCFVSFRRAPVVFWKRTRSLLSPPIGFIV
jgi:hypothetical protein